MKKANGFTLLELIIVMFLMTLMLSLAAVFFAGSLPSSRFSAVAREMAATIRHARSLAQIKGEKQTLSIDMDARRYGIDNVGGKDIPQDIYIKVEDPISGEISSGKYQLDFPPTGGVGGGTIVLWNAKRTVRIYIDPVVGSVVIK